MFCVPFRRGPGRRAASRRLGSGATLAYNVSGVSSQVYPLTSEPCGYCLIINNVNFDKDTDLKRRLGSNVDCQRLEKRFRALHFEILTKEDLTAQVSVSSRGSAGALGNISPPPQDLDSALRSVGGQLFLFLPPAPRNVDSALQVFSLSQSEVWCLVQPVLSGNALRKSPRSCRAWPGRITVPWTAAWWSSSPTAAR